MCYTTTVPLSSDRLEPPKLRAKIKLLTLLVTAVADAALATECQAVWKDTESDAVFHLSCVSTDY